MANFKQISFSNRIVEMLATGLYTGKVPILPGTAGTLLAFPLIYVFSKAGAMGFAVISGGFALFAIWVSGLYETAFKKHDNPQVVIDEVAGYLISVCFLPLDFKVLLAAFVLFRLLDMLKPFPISYFDRNVSGGYGVVVDDLVAGLITNLVLQLIVWQTNWLGVF